MIRITTNHPYVQDQGQRKVIYVVKWSKINGSKCVLLAVLSRKILHKHGFSALIRKAVRQQHEDGRMRLFEQSLKAVKK